MTRVVILLFLSALLYSSCTNQQTTSSIADTGWRLVFRNDGQGNAKFGKKEDLISAVRKGYPIRVGWGSGPKPNRPGSVEHVADADFLTIANEKEVFAQIYPIIGQAPDLKSDTITISFRTRNNWLRIFGTNGFTESLSYDLSADSVLSKAQRAVGASWYVNFPANNEADYQNGPLWD